MNKINSIINDIKLAFTFKKTLQLELLHHTEHIDELDMVLRMKNEAIREARSQADVFRANWNREQITTDRLNQENISLRRRINPKLTIKQPENMKATAV